MRFLLFFLMLSACTGIHRAEKLKDHIRKGTAIVSLHPGARDSIVFHYTGCGGFLLQQGDNAVLNDPFFSNRGPVALLNFRRLHTDTARVNRFFRSALPDYGAGDAGIIKALLVGHAHYDHFMDVPYIYHTWLNKDSVLLIGNEGVKRLMQISGKAYQARVNDQAILDAEREASDADSLRKWFYTSNGRIRILPILSEHAPQFKHLSLYTGAIADPIRAIPVRAGAWKEGAVLSYLVDFLTEDHRPAFRVFVQSSASTPSRGFPPVMGDGKAIDVAVICVASFSYVKDYPEALLKRLQARHLILVHWENFFQSAEQLDRKPMTVPFTNVSAFLKRLDQYKRETQGDLTWTLPQPGTRITIQY